MKDWRFIKALALCDSEDESEALQGATRAVPFCLAKKAKEKLVDFVAQKEQRNCQYFGDFKNFQRDCSSPF